MLSRVLSVIMVELMLVSMLVLATPATAQTAPLANSAAKTDESFTKTAAKTDESFTKTAARADEFFTNSGAKTEELFTNSAVQAEDSARFTFYNDKVETSGTSSGYTVSGTSVVINDPGIYRFSGTCENGNIDVSNGSGNVTIILDGLSLTSTSTAPIRLRGGTTNVTLTVADGTVNYLKDTNRNEESPKSAINVSKNLLINGKGYMEVTGNNKNGIKSDAGITIQDATIKVTAVDNGIAADNILTINSGDITVISGGDALKAAPDLGVTAELAGEIIINGGNIRLTANYDGIQAEGNLTINDGNFAVKTGGGSGFQTAAADSKKGMKTRLTFTINGGTFHFDTSDDSIHSDSVININGGSFDIVTGDDAVHADETLTIKGSPKLIIRKCYEGLEALTINILGGDINIVSSDDGINAAGGNDTSPTNPNPWPWQPPGGQTNGLINIEGGHIVVSSIGDGIDSNGRITMSGGTVIVHGPANSMDMPIDYDQNTFVLTGGYIVTDGVNTTSQQAPSSTSTVRSIRITYNSSQPAGTFMNLRDSSGNRIATFKPAKAYRSVLVSSPEIRSGQQYYIDSGGSVSGGSENGGLFTGGTYSGGTQRGSVTSNSVISAVTLSFTSSTTASQSVSVGAQTGALWSGAVGTVTFPVTTANIVNGSYTALVANLPTGVWVQGPVVINNNSGTLTLAGNISTLAGTTSTLRLTIDLATSSAFALTIDSSLTFIAAQVGGTNGSSSTTGIELIFNQAVTGLSAGDITITNGSGVVTKGALSGSGTSWTIGITVQTPGIVTVSVGSFGSYTVTTGPQSLEVFAPGYDNLAVAFRLALGTSGSAIAATGGVLGSDAGMEFYYANGTRASLGHATRAAVSCPNSTAGWYLDAGTITENSSAGWIITMSTSKFVNMKFSAEQASSNNGPGEFKLAYRIGTAGGWIGFGGMAQVSALSDSGTTAGTFSEVALPAAMENKPVVQLKVYISSNIVRLGGTSGTVAPDNGNTSINNIVITGEPGNPVDPDPAYAVTFLDYNGNILSFQEVTAGAAAKEPTSPVRKGYTFIGWDKDFGNITGDLDINALYWKPSAQPHVLINQAHCNGGTVGSVSHSFIELYNPTGNAVDLGGYSVQYASNGVWSVLPLTGKMINAYSSFLIVTTPAVDPGSPNYTISNYDMLWAVNVDNRAFNVALVNGQAALTPRIAIVEWDSIVDLLGAVNNPSSDSISNYLGSGPVVDVTRQRVARRIDFADTGDNSEDFESLDYRASAMDETRLAIVRPRWSGDGSWGPTPVPIASLRINAVPAVRVKRGETLTFTLNLNDGAVADGIVWTISNVEYATVDNKGTVEIFDKTGAIVLAATDPSSGLCHSIILRIT